MIIVSQDKKSVFNTQHIESVRATHKNDMSEIYIKTLSGEEKIIAAYSQKEAADKSFAVLQGALCGTYEMPTNEEALSGMDCEFSCCECHAKNKIPFETLSNLSKSMLHSPLHFSGLLVHCSACGMRQDLYKKEKRNYTV